MTGAANGQGALCPSSVRKPASPYGLPPCRNVRLESHAPIYPHGNEAHLGRYASGCLPGSASVRTASARTVPKGEHGSDQHLDIPRCMLGEGPGEDRCGQTKEIGI